MGLSLGASIGQDKSLSQMGFLFVFDTFVAGEIAGNFAPFSMTVSCRKAVAGAGVRYAMERFPKNLNHDVQPYVIYVIPDETLSPNTRRHCILRD